MALSISEQINRATTDGAERRELQKVLTALLDAIKAVANGDAPALAAIEQIIKE